MIDPSQNRLTRPEAPPIRSRRRLVRRLVCALVPRRVRGWSLDPTATGPLAKRPGSTLPGAAVALVACVSSAGCGGSDSSNGNGGGTSDASSPAEGAALEVLPEHRERAVEVLAILTPPPPEQVEDQNPWIDARREFMRAADQEAPQVGLALVEMIRESPQDRVIMRGALEAAARCAPAQTTPYLLELIDDTNADLGLRETATTMIGHADPQAAIDVLEVLLRDRPRGTYPPGDSILRGWLTAVRALDIDPVPVLSLVATDIYHEDATRHQALRELGDAATPLAREALREVLIESTGNGYLRRLAAQSVAKAFDTAEACEILEEVALREADVTMQVFLASLVDANCP